MYKGILAVFSGNFLGKVIGLIREAIIASLYGTSSVVGAFRISQSVSLIPVNFFTSDTLNAGFIPLYKRLKKVDDDKSQSLFWFLHITLGVTAFIIFLILYFFAEKAVIFIAPGIGNNDIKLASQFVRIIASCLPFYVLSALYANLAIANNLYFLVAVRPTIQSIGVIAGVLLSYFLDNVLFFAWGFFLAYVYLFLYSLYSLWVKSLLYFRFSYVKVVSLELWVIIRPLLFLPVFLQGNIIVERIVASFLGIEVIAAIDYAKFITETGMVLLAIPIGIAGLSQFSSLSLNDTKDRLRTLLPIVLILTIPASFFLSINSEVLVSILFERGAFTQDSVFLTANILFGLSFGFWAQVLSYILLKAMSANFKNREVFLFMIIAVLINSIFNFTFYRYFGPVTLGLGVSLYGLVLLFLTLKMYGLFKLAIKYCMYLFLGGIVYSIFVILLNLNESWFVSFSFFTLFWFIYLILAKPLRKPIVTLYRNWMGRSI